MIGTPIEPVKMARDACDAMTEEDRLVFATLLLSKATSPRSKLQLRRAERAAREARIALEREETFQQVSS